MTRPMISILGPVILWSLHFIAVYALISAACAPRGLIGIDVMRATVGLVTLAPALAILAWLLTAGHRLREGTEAQTDTTFATAAWWCALISLLAVILNLWPVVWLTACTG